MNRLALLLSVIALALIGLGSLAVGTLSARQKLGAPGVRVTMIPLIGEDGRLTRSNSVPLPMEVPGFQFRTASVTDLELNYLPPDTTFGRGRYVGTDGFWAQVNVVLMGTDRTSIHRPEYCLTGQGWRILHKQETSVPLKRGTETVEFPVQRFDGKLSTVADGRQIEVGGVYVFWFVADGMRTASHWQRQWWMIRDLVTRGVLQRWAYVSFFAPCPPGREDETFERLTRLISATAPHFELTGDVASR